MFNHAKENRDQNPNFTILLPENQRHVKVKKQEEEEPFRRVDGKAGVRHIGRPSRFLSKQISQAPMSGPKILRKEPPSPWTYINDNHGHYVGRNWKDPSGNSQ